MKTLIQKDKENNLGTIILRCDDKCCMLSVDKYKYQYKWNGHEDIDYNFMMSDDYYNYNINTFFGRLKRAFNALFGKPIVFSSLYVEGSDNVIAFRDALTELINKNE